MSREIKNLMESEIYGPPSVDDGSYYSEGLRRSVRVKKRQDILPDTQKSFPDSISSITEIDTESKQGSAAHFSKGRRCTVRLKKSQDILSTSSLRSIKRKKTTEFQIRKPLPDRGFHSFYCSTPINELFPDSFSLSTEMDIESDLNLEPFMQDQPFDTKDQGRAASFVEDISYAFDTRENSALGNMRTKP